jgi:hypothetical protein
LVSSRLPVSAVDPSRRSFPLNTHLCFRSVNSQGWTQHVKHKDSPCLVHALGLDSSYSVHYPNSWELDCPDCPDCGGRPLLHQTSANLGEESVCISTVSVEGTEYLSGRRRAADAGTCPLARPPDIAVEHGRQGRQGPSQAGCCSPLLTGGVPCSCNLFDAT